MFSALMMMQAVSTGKPELQVIVKLVCSLKKWVKPTNPVWLLSRNRLWNSAREFLVTTFLFII